MLVPFDEKSPRKRVKDFIYPHIENAEPTFVGINKPTIWTKGIVVFVGLDITANDVFARIVDSGAKIDSVDDLFSTLQSYVTQLSEFKIGNILEIEKDDLHGFRLTKFADRIQISGTSKIP